MAPAKKTKGAKTPPSSKSVPAPPAKPVSMAPRDITRREEREARRAANKAKYAADMHEGKQLAASILTNVKAQGVKAAAKVKRPKLPPVIAKTGRPPIHPPFAWSDELGQQLFMLVSTGHSMQEIAAMDDMPSLFDMLKWSANTQHPFARIRAQAKELLVLHFEEQARMIAQTPSIGVVRVTRQVIDRDGNKRTLRETRESDNVERAKLAVQGLQWTLGHLMPKKHGPKATDVNTDPNEQLEGLFAALHAGPAK